MKLFFKDLSTKCNQIWKLLRIWSHLLKESLMKNFIFCEVLTGEKRWTSTTGILKNWCIDNGLILLSFQETNFLIQLNWNGRYFRISKRILLTHIYPIQTFFCQLWSVPPTIHVLIQFLPMLSCLLLCYMYSHYINHCFMN